MDLKLGGKRALVTGGTAGIGEGIAHMLASEGVRVVINGRDPQRAEAVATAICAQGGAVAIVMGDIGTDGDAHRIAAEAEAAFGGIDILVNNAGFQGSASGTTDWFAVTGEEWLNTLSVNLVGAARLARALVPAMKDRRWGRIIQISSGSGTSPTSAMPDYGASKAALNNMTLGMSKALAKTGVTVNAIASGLILTPAVERWLAHIGEQQGFGNDRERAMAYALDHYHHQNVDRFGMVDDIANVVAYLASPLADYVTGANWRVDGGGSESL